MRKTLTQAQDEVITSRAIRRVLLTLGLVASVTVANAPSAAGGGSQPAVDPEVAAVIQQIQHGEDCLGWSDFLLGMTLREAEAISGRPIRDALVEYELGGGHHARVEHHGTEVVLGFSADDPSAVLESIALRFPAPQHPQALKAAVRSVVPDAVYWRGRHARGDTYVAEEDEASPNYLIPGRAGDVILVHPTEGSVALCAPADAD